jgi:hypothetical protein
MAVWPPVTWWIIEVDPVKGVRKERRLYCLYSLFVVSIPGVLYVYAYSYLTCMLYSDSIKQRTCYEKMDWNQVPVPDCFCLN